MDKGALLWFFLKIGIKNETCTGILFNLRCINQLKVNNLNQNTIKLSFFNSL